MSRSNTIELVGSTVLVENDHLDRFLPDLLWAIQLRDDAPIDAAYLADFFATSTGRRLLQGAAMGTSGSMKKLSMQRLRKIEVPCPARPLQRRWAAARRAFNANEFKHQEITSAKVAFRRSLMTELLTARRRFPEFGEEWGYVALGQLVEPLNRRNVEGAVARVLTCSGRFGLVQQTDFFTKSVASDSLEAYLLLQRSEFAYNRSAMNGYPYGAIKRLDNYPNGVLSTLNICFALRSDAWTSDFAVHVFESGILEQQLGRITRVGSRAHGLLNITKGDFFGLQVPVPIVAEQRKIAKVLDALGRELSTLERQRHAYEAQKRALMQRLLSGDTDNMDPAA